VGTGSELRSSAVGRIAAIVAIAVVAVAAVLLLMDNGDEYTVTADFENASQLVPGNLVLVGGAQVGKVTDIELGPHGGALVTFSVDPDFAPLRRGTTATVRNPSLASIANREIDLTLPPDSENTPEIADGGTLDRAETVSAVDLDEVFNTLDTKTVKDFKKVIEGFAASYAGKGTPQKANQGSHYINPFLSTSREVFGELTSDTPAFEKLLVDTSHLSGALASRSGDISALVGNTDRMMSAIASQRTALSDAINQLPPFMRQANTTFVNLRSTLDDLDPLVSASKPVADRLSPFFRQFRFAARDAVPTVRDLDQIIQKPGRDNDLVELMRSQLPLAKAGVGSGAPDCGSDPNSASQLAHPQDQNFTQGALGEANCALRNSIPQMSFLRPYTPELIGWFDDFSKPGLTDVNGGIGRVGTLFNAFSLQAGLPDLGLSPIDAADVIRGIGSGSLSVGNTERCPGALERPAPDGGNPFTDGGTLACDKTQVPPGS
jgi:phospholipid/cholesterol/gamma-HCH transport system substrate-binding protein